MHPCSQYTNTVNINFVLHQYVVYSVYCTNRMLCLHALFRFKHKLISIILDDTDESGRDWITPDETG